jgi:hypothetical protein
MVMDKPNKDPPMKHMRALGKERPELVITKVMALEEKNWGDWSIVRSKESWKNGTKYDPEERKEEWSEQSGKWPNGQKFDYGRYGQRY